MRFSAHIKASRKDNRIKSRNLLIRLIGALALYSLLDANETPPRKTSGRQPVAVE